MATVNEKLLRFSIDHQINLQRYSNGVVRRMIAILNKSDDKLTTELLSALQRLPAESFTVKRLESLLKDVRTLNTKAYEAVGKSLEGDLSGLVESEAEFQKELFETVLPVELSVASIDAEKVYTAAMARPFQISKDRAVPMTGYLDGLSADRAGRIRDAVRLGYINGETTDQIIRSIRGTKTQNYADGLMEAPRHHIEGMVRTAINHMSNFTAQRFYEANSELIKGWQFVATLDGRTSITCASLSGKIFPIGSGPMPPRHTNCRSTSVPVTKSWRELGFDIDEFKSTRSSMDGQIPDDITFTEWLRSKPSSFQDDILGSTRGKLFRSNEIEVNKFTNNKGKVYSIDELRKRNKELFQKAGL